MKIQLDTDRPEDYELFLRIKGLPRFRFQGHEAYIPDEYASLIGLSRPNLIHAEYQPNKRLFDYQKAFSGLAIRKRKFALFVTPGYGKTLMGTEFARHGLEQLPSTRCALWVSPLMVVKQTIREIQKFYGDDLPVRQLRASELQEWLVNGKERFGITNYESLKPDLKQGRIGLLVADESSIMKDSGKWCRSLINLGRGIEWKLCLTGTPAPNDRIEYANHAVFLDQSPNTNAFLARYFVNRGQTDNRWEMKPHALKPFYIALSHWCVFMNDPGVYGFKDNAGSIPPIHVHIHDIDLTERQRELVCKAGGDMYGTPSGITSRSKLSQLAKGRMNGEEVPTAKFDFIRDLVSQWPDESTLIWALYNQEQDRLEKTFPEAGSISGTTNEEDRERIIFDFQEGRIKQLISKSKCLGWGLNLQRATRHVFSGLMDSYESFTQCVKRSNRVGSTLPLNVHLPITPIERKMVETVLVKAKRVQQDTEEQEAIFKEYGYDLANR